MTIAVIPDRINSLYWIEKTEAGFQLDPQLVKWIDERFVEGQSFDVLDHLSQKARDRMVDLHRTYGDSIKSKEQGISLYEEAVAMLQDAFLAYRRRDSIRPGQIVNCFPGEEWLAKKNQPADYHTHFLVESLVPNSNVALGRFCNDDKLTVREWKLASWELVYDPVSNETSIDELYSHSMGIGYEMALAIEHILKRQEEGLAG